MKIAILGNSHSGCLARALKADPTLLGDNETVFFASGGAKMGNLRVEDGVLVPTNDELRENIFRSSGGLHHIDPKKFDIFLLISLKLHVPYIVQNTYSEAVVRTTYRAAVRGPIVWDVATRLRSLSHAPIYCGHSPLRALTPTEFRNKFGAKRVLSYSETLRRVQEEFNALSVSVIEQPSVTIDHEMTTTMPEYQLHEGGYAILKDGTRSRDWSHMNTEYGRLYLSSVYKNVIQPAEARFRV